MSSLKKFAKVVPFSNYDFHPIILVHYSSGHKYPIKTICADVNYIYSAGDTTIRVWDKTALKEIATLAAHTHFINCIYVDDEFLYSAGEDGMVRIWDKTSFTEIATLPHKGTVNCVYADSDHLYSADDKGAVRVLEKTSFTEITTLPHKGTVNSVYADNAHLYSAGEDGMVRVWDKTTFTEIATLTTSSLGITVVCADTFYIYSTGGTRVDVWNKITFKKIAILDAHSSAVESLYVDENFIYGGLRDGTISMWDKKTHTIIALLTGDKDQAVNDVYADSQYIYSASSDKTVRIYDKTTLTEIIALQEHADKVKCVHADNWYIYSSSLDETIRVYDKATYQVKAILPNFRARSIHDDKKYLYIIHDDGVVILDKGILKKRIDKEVGEDDGVVLFPDSQLQMEVDSDDELVLLTSATTLYVDKQYIYVASADMRSPKVVVWRKRNFTKVATLTGLQTIPLGVYADKKYVYAATRDKYVEVWEKETWNKVNTEIIENRFGKMSKAWLWFVGRKWGIPYAFGGNHLYYREENKKFLENPRWLEKSWKTGVVLEETQGTGGLIIINGETLHFLPPKVVKHVEIYKSFLRTAATRKNSNKCTS